MLIRLFLLAAFGLTSLAPAIADAQNRARRPAPVQRSSPRAEFERGLLASEAGPLFAAMRSMRLPRILTWWSVRPR